MLSAQDYQGLYAIIPTPAKPGAAALMAEHTVDLDETARLVEALIRDGARGLIALGTTGECATLSHADYETFVTCVLDVTAGRIPAIIGASALGGHEIARRLKFLKTQKADGALIGLPQWQPMTTGMAVRMFAEISEAFPDLSVMVYANARAFRYSFPAEFWTAVAAAAPTVTAAKMSRPKDLAGLLAATHHRINFMPNESTVHAVHAQAPDVIRSCWATAAAMGPRPAILLIEAILAGDTAQAKHLADRIAWACAPIDDIIRNPELFAATNIQVEKTRIAAAGYCKPGPIRSPYDELAPEHHRAAEECGRRWATLCRELEAAAPDAAAAD